MKKQKIKDEKKIEKIKIEFPKTENIPLFMVYKNGSSMFIEISKDTSMFELFGFLKCFVKDLEYDLLEKVNKK